MNFTIPYKRRHFHLHELMGIKVSVLTEAGGRLFLVFLSLFFFLFFCDGKKKTPEEWKEQLSISHWDPIYSLSDSVERKIKATK